MERAREVVTDMLTVRGKMYADRLIAATARRSHVLLDDAAAALWQLVDDGTVQHNMDGTIQLSMQLGSLTTEREATGPQT